MFFHILFFPRNSLIGKYAFLINCGDWKPHRTFVAIAFSVFRHIPIDHWNTPYNWSCSLFPKSARNGRTQCFEKKWKSIQRSTSVVSYTEAPPIARPVENLKPGGSRDCIITRCYHTQPNSSSMVKSHFECGTQEGSVGEKRLQTGPRHI